MVHALGGPADFCERPETYLPKAPEIRPVLAARDGFLSRCETRAVGMAVVELGGGRRRASDPIDHRVGISDILPLGTQVQKGDRIATVHAATPGGAERGAADINACYEISDQKPVVMPVVIGRIG
jgi:thymidine phosphorylase